MIAAILFGVLGVPFLAMLSLGERTCDIDGTHSCSVSWGGMQMIYFVGASTVCLLLAWLIIRAFGRRE